MKWWLIAFWVVAIIGFVLRFYALGRIPAGLNGDEIEEGVEAISILATSMDRWGNYFPVFFSHVGSGMQPLYTYLTIPLFALFGPSAFLLRLTSASLGFLTLFTTYHIGKMSFGRDVGLLSMLFLAFLPWHMMDSRWGIDWSILPFWFSLGILTMTMALKPEANVFWKLVAFVPWAICIYTYFGTIIPITTISIVTIYSFRKVIFAQWQLWCGAVAIAFIIDIPIILFIFVNFLKITFPLRLTLPFSIPILPVSRFDEVSEPFLSRFIKNITFLVSGYRDGLVWNQSANFLPLTALAPILTITAIISVGVTAIKNRCPNLLLNILLAALIPLFTIRLNLNRFNWFYIPSIIVCAALIVDITRHISVKSVRNYWISGLCAYLAVFLGMFYLNYFTQYNNEILSEDITLGNGFRVGLEDALHIAIDKADARETIYVDAGVSHPYLYVIFYGFADIRSFQMTRRLRAADDKLYHVVGFDRFIFEREAIPIGAPYLFVTRPDRLPCNNPRILESGLLWSVGQCSIL